MSIGIVAASKLSELHDSIVQSNCHPYRVHVLRSHRESFCLLIDIPDKSVLPTAGTTLSV